MKILIVEDEAPLREGEVAYLQSAGYETREAGTGTEALALLHSETFDLVLLDINLPGVSGLEVCKKLREKSDTPVIMVTARVEDEDELKGFELGVQDYVKKPFNPQVLIARVKAVLHDATKPLQVADLCIDPETHTVARGEECLSLTAVQFEILLRMARRPGTTFTRDQLVHEDAFDRSIDAHIKRLRKKLGDRPHNPKYIETVVGVGYRFKK
jgi:DNA-binding response OmpR family regulator